MWLTDGRRSLLLQGERIARVEAGKRGLFVEALTPGLQDAHAHPLYWGVALRGLDLSGLKDPEAVAREVARKAQKLPPGAWVEGQGFLFASPPPPGLLDRAARCGVAFLAEGGLAHLLTPTGLAPLGPAEDTLYLSPGERTLRCGEVPWF